MVDTLDNTEHFNMHKAKKKIVKIKHSYGGLQQAMCYLRDEQRSLKSVMKQTPEPRKIKARVHDLKEKCRWPCHSGKGAQRCQQSKELKQTQADVSFAHQSLELSGKRANEPWW